MKSQKTISQRKCHPNGDLKTEEVIARRRRGSKEDYLRPRGHQKVQW
jgi:hypothetical protein